MASPMVMTRADLRARAIDPDTPPDELATLAHDDRWRIRAAVAANPSTPPDVLTELVADPDPRVRRRLIAHPSLPDPLRLRLFADPVRAVRIRTLCTNPTPELLCVARHDPLLGHLAMSLLLRECRDPVRGGTFCRRLVDEPSARLRAVAAGSVVAPIDVLDRAARDGAEVRASLAQNPALPAHLALRLAGDNSTAVRASLASNPSIDRDIQRSLLARRRRVEGHDPVPLALGSNPGVDVGVVATLARHERSDVRARVAANPSTPGAVLARLVRTGTDRVRIAAAANPALLPDQLHALARDESPMITFAAAQNPNLSDEDRYHLSASPDVHVAGLSRTHPRATAEDLHELAVSLDAEAWVLRRASAHPNCAREERDAIATWLALGGAGDRDPHFDPVTCTGNPGNTAVRPDVEWERLGRERARAGSPSPLWRVRAVQVGLLRIDDLLAPYLDDPVAAVRHTAVRRRVTVRELAVARGDEDADVRHLASQIHERRRSTTRPRRRIDLRWVPLAVLLFIPFSALRSRSVAPAPPRTSIVTLPDVFDPVREVRRAFDDNPSFRLVSIGPIFASEDPVRPVGTAGATGLSTDWIASPGDAGAARLSLVLTSLGGASGFTIEIGTVTSRMAVLPANAVMVVVMEGPPSASVTVTDTVTGTRSTQRFAG